MVYRVVLAKVNGRSVQTTSGRTLFCIGNRQFKAGDIAFTDGRYVYGFDYVGGSEPIFNESGNYLYYKPWSNEIWGLRSNFKPKRMGTTKQRFGNFICGENGCYASNQNMTVFYDLVHDNKRIDLQKSCPSGVYLSNFLDACVSENGDLISLYYVTHEGTQNCTCALFVNNQPTFYTLIDAAKETINYEVPHGYITYGHVNGPEDFSVLFVRQQAFNLSHSEEYFPFDNALTSGHILFFGKVDAAGNVSEQKINRNSLFALKFGDEHPFSGMFWLDAGGTSGFSTKVNCFSPLNGTKNLEDTTQTFVSHSLQGPFVGDTVRAITIWDHVDYTLYGADSAGNKVIEKEYKDITLVRKYKNGYQLDKDLEYLCVIDRNDIKDIAEEGLEKASESTSSSFNPLSISIGTDFEKKNIELRIKSEDDINVRDLPLEFDKGPFVNSGKLDALKSITEVRANRANKYLLLYKDGIYLYDGEKLLPLSQNNERYGNTRIVKTKNSLIRRILRNAAQLEF